MISKTVFQHNSALVLPLQNIYVAIPLNKMDTNQMKIFMCKQDLTKIYYIWLGKKNEQSLEE